MNPKRLTRNQKDAINKRIAAHVGFNGNFCADLQAMHQAEEELLPRGAGKTTYERAILSVFGIRHMPYLNQPVFSRLDEHPMFQLIHATAAQRAVAFCRFLDHIEKKRLLP